MSNTPTTLKGRTRHISLAFMGEEWAEAYIDVRYLTWGDTKRIREAAAENTTDDAAVESLFATIKDAFVSGKSLNDEGELVAITAADIEQFDLQAVQELYQAVLGVSNPKD